MLKLLYMQWYRASAFEEEKPKMPIYMNRYLLPNPHKFVSICLAVFSFLIIFYVGPVSICAICCVLDKESWKKLCCILASSKMLSRHCWNGYERWRRFCQKKVLFMETWTLLWHL